MNVIQYVGAVTLVLALLLLCVGVLRRTGIADLKIAMGVKSQPRAMQVIERLPLTPNHSLHLVQCEGEMLLVGISPSGCSLLKSSATLPPPQLHSARTV